MNQDREDQPEKPQPPRRMSDAEFADRCAGSQPFEVLVELLGNRVKAAHAIRAEAEFVDARRKSGLPELPQGDEFAAKVRGWLVTNKLDWTQENLEKAVASAVSQG
jgi:hypothetical protein